MKLFCVYDVKANIYMQPFPEQSTISALRGFELAVNGKETIFSKFPDDFCLMELADFDQQTGQIHAHMTPLNMGSARTVLKQPTQESPLFAQARDPVLRINEDKAHQ